MTTYKPGTPSWVDVSVPDAAAGADFYSAIFGWEVGEAGDPEEIPGVGRFAVVADPQGAHFAVIKPQPPGDSGGD